MMNRRKTILELRARVPRCLRALRARMLLEQWAECLGVQEVECPACSGCGWLDERRLEHCPICCGFREVPRGLAEWFEVEMIMPRHRLRMRLLPACAREPEPEGVRYGRSAEFAYSVSGSDLGRLAACDPRESPYGD